MSQETRRRRRHIVHDPAIQMAWHPPAGASLRETGDGEVADMGWGFCLGPAGSAGGVFLLPGKESCLMLGEVRWHAPAEACSLPACLMHAVK